MANQWFRLYAEFSTDPKVQMMPEVMQRRLVMLFCLRCNSDVTLQCNEVTFQLRISVTEWQETKALFMAKGFIDEANNILHWDKRQFRSDSSAARVTKHREKLKTMKQPCNVTVTPPDTDTDTDKKERKIPPAPKLEKMLFDILPDEWRQYAKSEKGWDDPIIEIVWSGFRDYWQDGKGKTVKRKEWSATWKKWCLKENINSQKGAGNVHGTWKSEGDRVVAEYKKRADDERARQGKISGDGRPALLLSEGIRQDPGSDNLAD